MRVKFKPPTPDQMIADLCREVNELKADRDRALAMADRYQQRNQRQAAIIKLVRKAVYAAGSEEE